MHLFKNRKSILCSFCCMSVLVTMLVRRAIWPVAIKRTSCCRYRDGSDHISEHRDDEKDLDHSAPIASLSFGQTRDFVLKHSDLRRKIRHVDPVKISLEHGSLLLMNPPTNRYWYHSLPPRKSAIGVRVNLTFRCLVHG